jgi:hypothetical protein
MHYPAQELAAQGRRCAFNGMDWSHRATGPLCMGAFSATDYSTNAVLLRQSPAASEPDCKNTRVIPVLGPHGLFASRQMAEDQDWFSSREKQIRQSLRLVPCPSVVL